MTPWGGEQGISPEVIEEMRKVYLNEDVTQEQLARRYGVGRDAVYRSLVGHSRPKPKRRAMAKLTPEKVTLLRKVHAEDPNVSFAQRGEEFGVSGNQARLIVRREAWRDTP